MARKLRPTPIKLDEDLPLHFCAPVEDCHIRPPSPPPPPPPPPPPRLSPHSQLSPYLIIMFCSLAVAFSFICYLALLKALRKHSRRTSLENPNEAHQDFLDEDHGPFVNHPIWLINTVGLEQSVIDSIEVFKYKTSEGLIEGTDCSVCLSEFQDDESLRLLPKCSHAFHVPCIDTWLRSHKNCPLCRAPIVNNAQVHSSFNESTSQEETPVGDSENVDHLGENESNEAENATEVNNSDGVGQELQPKRRSVSLDSRLASMVHSAVAKAPFADEERGLDPKTPNMSQKSTKGHTGSSSSISMYGRVMKSSSFGRSSRKAGGFMKRSYSSSGKCLQNRSY